MILISCLPYKEAEFLICTIHIFFLESSTLSLKLLLYVTILIILSIMKQNRYLLFDMDNKMMKLNLKDV